MKFNDLIDKIHCRFEVYYKGQYIDEYNFMNIKPLYDNYKWILDCEVAGIECDTKDMIIIYLNN